MRVTKRVEDYIRDEIIKAIPTPEAVLALKKAREDFNEIIQGVKEKVEAFAKTEVEALASDNPQVKGLELDGCYTRICWKGFEDDEEVHQLERDTYAKREKAINSICIALELGAKKNEIPQLIAAAIAECES